MRIKYEEMTEYQFLKAVTNPDIDADEPNVPLLRKHVDWVKEQSKLDHQRYDQDVYWNQGTWGVVTVSSVEEAGVATKEMTCQTGCCLAGNVAIQDDVTFILQQETPYMMGVRTKDNTVYTIETYAALKLGLNFKECDDISLFAAENGVEEIEEMAKVIAERAGETL